MSQPGRVLPIWKLIPTAESWDNASLSATAPRLHMMLVHVPMRRSDGRQSSENYFAEMNKPYTDHLLRSRRPISSLTGAIHFGSRRHSALREFSTFPRQAAAPFDQADCTGVPGGGGTGGRDKRLSQNYTDC